MDKNTSSDLSGLKLLCVGTDITGYYLSGLNVGVALMAGISVGAYASVLGQQSACFLISGGYFKVGAEISPYSLRIEKR